MFYKSTNVWKTILPNFYWAYSLIPIERTTLCWWGVADICRCNAHLLLVACIIYALSVVYTASITLIFCSFWCIFKSRKCAPHQQKAAALYKRGVVFFPCVKESLSSSLVRFLIQDPHWEDIGSESVRLQSDLKSVWNCGLCTPPMWYIVFPFHNYALTNIALRPFPAIPSAIFSI